MSQALINALILFSPVIIMGIALLIHDVFFGSDYIKQDIEAQYAARRAEYLKLTQTYEGDK